LISGKELRVKQNYKVDGEKIKKNIAKPHNDNWILLQSIRNTE